MAKDPATLWYWNDWHSGTVTFTRHLKGCYMDLLHAQFNNGRLSLDAIKTVLGNDFASWGALSKKFLVDEQGLYYNERAELEQDKRKKFSESRRNNLISKPKITHMKPHMENENEIDIWINGFELLKEDGRWFVEEIEMKFNIPETELNHRLEQYWLSLQKSNFKGQLKQIRSGFIKWLKTWNEKDKNNGNKTRKGHDIENVVSTADRILLDYQNKLNSTSGEQSDTDISDIEKRA